MKHKFLKFTLGAAGAAALGFVGLSGLVCYEVFNRKANLVDMVNEKAPPEENPYTDRLTWMDEQEYVQYKITDYRGKTLNAYMLPAKEKSDVYVFCSHGYRSTGKIGFRYITKYWHEKGYNVFLIDQQANGESEGQRISFGYYESRNVIEWLNFMNDTFGEDIRIILHGVSLGCATILLAIGSGELPKNVKFAIADCGFTSVEDEFTFHLESVKLPPKPVIAATSAINKLAAGYDYRDVRPIDAVKQAKIPILFIHGEKDDFVPTKMVYPLYEACPTDKDLCIIPDAGHAEAYHVNPPMYEAAIEPFIEKYL